MSSRSPDALLPIRSAVVFLIAALVALVAGVLGYFADGGVPAALLVAGGAGGAALALPHRLVDCR